VGTIKTGKEKRGRNWEIGNKGGLQKKGTIDQRDAYTKSMTSDEGRDLRPGTIEKKA